MKNPPRTLRTKYGVALLNRKGYFYLPNGYGEGKPCNLHRKIYMDHIGRRIPKEYEVHHIDGNRLNNNIDNLVALHKDDHSLLHE